MNRRQTIMTLVVCATLVVGGAALELTLVPRYVPRPAEPLHDTPAKATLTQQQLDAVLAKAAKHLAPPLRARLSEAVFTEAGRAGYDPLFVLALVSVESSFRVRVSSDRGAAGLMQLKPSTFAWISAREPDVGGDDSAVAEDPVIDVRLAIRYFHWLERRFHEREDALMAYNAGPRRLLQYKQSGDVPESLREYPRRIQREYERFTRMAGGGTDPQNLLIAKAN